MWFTIHIESVQIKKDLGLLGIQVGRLIINKGLADSDWAGKIVLEFADSAIELIGNYGRSITGLESLTGHCSSIQAFNENRGNRQVS